MRRIRLGRAIQSPLLGSALSCSIVPCRRAPRFDTLAETHARETNQAGTSRQESDFESLAELSCPGAADLAARPPFTDGKRTAEARVTADGDVAAVVGSAAGGATWRHARELIPAG